MCLGYARVVFVVAFLFDLISSFFSIYIEEDSPNSRQHRLPIA